MSQINIAQVDLNLLKTFEALHDESSASRAALRLGVTQSAISAGLRRLREVYGDQLFVRTGRGLAPTLRANQLKPLISEALDRCRQSLAMVDPNNQHYQGRSVVLGLSDDFEIAYGRRLIEEIARRAPPHRQHSWTICPFFSYKNCLMTKNLDFLSCQDSVRVIFVGCVTRDGLLVVNNFAEAAGSTTRK